jgi:hypothetical protein
MKFLVSGIYCNIYMYDFDTVELYLYSGVTLKLLSIKYQDSLSINIIRFYIVFLRVVYIEQGYL